MTRIMMLVIGIKGDGIIMMSTKEARTQSSLLRLGDSEGVTGDGN